MPANGTDDDWHWVSVVAEQRLVLRLTPRRVYGQL
jgi:hypothetical protein